MSEHVPFDSVPLGNTGLRISPLGIGAMAWGDCMMWECGHGYTEDDLKVSFDAGIAALDRASDISLG